MSQVREGAVWCASMFVCVCLCVRACVCVCRAWRLCKPCLRHLPVVCTLFCAPISFQPHKQPNKQKKQRARVWRRKRRSVPKLSSSSESGRRWSVHVQR